MARKLLPRGLSWILGSAWQARVVFHLLASPLGLASVLHPGRVNGNGHSPRPLLSAILTPNARRRIAICAARRVRARRKHATRHTATCILGGFPLLWSHTGLRVAMIHRDWLNGGCVPHAAARRASMAHRQGSEPDLNLETAGVYHEAVVCAPDCDPPPIPHHRNESVKKSDFGDRDVTIADVTHKAVLRVPM